MIPIYQEWALDQFGYPTSAAFAHTLGHFAWAGERARTPSGRFTASRSFLAEHGGFKGCC